MAASNHKVVGKRSLTYHVSGRPRAQIQGIVLTDTMELMQTWSSQTRGYALKVPSKVHVEILNPIVIVLGGGALGRRTGS